MSSRPALTRPVTQTPVSVSAAMDSAPEARREGDAPGVGGAGPLSGPAGELVVPQGIRSATSTDGRPLVLGDLLVTLAGRDGLVPDVVVAHSLKGGRKVWEYKAESFSTYGLAREPDGRIAVLADHGGGHVILLDAAGAERGRIEPDDVEGAALSIRPELIPVTDGHVVVNHMSMRGEPAVFSLR